VFRAEKTEMISQERGEQEPVKQGYKSITLLIQSITNVQIWKETQPELLHYLETYQVNLLKISLSGSNILLEINISSSRVDDFLINIKEILDKMDSIHGTKTPSKVVRSLVGLSLEVNNFSKNSLENLENELLNLEVNQRKMGISIKKLLKSFNDFQILYFKRLENLEEKVDVNLKNLDIKTSKLEKSLQKYMKA
jgi:hypothetical protein